MWQWDENSSIFSFLIARVLAFCFILHTYRLISTLNHLKSAVRYSSFSDISRILVEESYYENAPQSAHRQTYIVVFPLKTNDDLKTIVGRKQALSLKYPG